MMPRRLILATLVLGVLAAGAGLSQAQGDYQRKVEEYNAYVDTTRSQDPGERLQLIETFLKNYPESQYRAFLYPSYIQTAWQLQRYPTVMKAVDDFWGLDRDQVVKTYKESNADINDLAIDNEYYKGALLYTYSFLQHLQSNPAQAGRLTGKAAERARQGLELHEKLYRQVQAPSDPAQRKQFEQQKQQAESAFHTVLADGAWRRKDYGTAAREYSVLLGYTRDDAAINYRLGLAHLQKEPADAVKGMWYVARAINLNIPKKGNVKDFLVQRVAGYQRVLAGCATRQAEKLIAQAQSSVGPPARLPLVTAEEIAAARENLNVKRIFDDLQAGGEQEEMIWLASCGMELPDVPGRVIEVENSDETLTLRVAATQEAAEAKIANVEVKVVEPPQGKALEAGDYIQFSGVLTDYQNQPQFLLRLVGGKVKRPEGEQGS